MQTVYLKGRELMSWRKNALIPIFKLSTQVRGIIAIQQMGDKGKRVATGYSLTLKSAMIGFL